MLALHLSWVLLPFYTAASRSPSSTIYSNSTTLSSAQPLITDCPVDCYRDRTAIPFIEWSQAYIATTITAATVVIIVNNATNTTRTSTIYNSSVDTDMYPPPTATNSAGTAIAFVTRQEDNSLVTHTVAYPTTAYNDYVPDYSICGTFSTTLGANATCVQARDCTTAAKYSWLQPGFNTKASVYQFPSHPPIPDGVQGDVDMMKDPKGWTYVPLLVPACDGADKLQSLFPGLGVWSCQPLNDCVDRSDAGNEVIYYSGPPGDTAPTYANGNAGKYGTYRYNAPVALQTALHLTVTSTSIETGGSPPARAAEHAPSQNSPATPNVATNDQATNKGPASVATALGQEGGNAGLAAAGTAQGPPVAATPTAAGAEPLDSPGIPAAAPGLKLITTTNAGGEVMVALSTPDPSAVENPGAANFPEPSSTPIPDDLVNEQGSPLPIVPYLPTVPSSMSGAESIASAASFSLPTPALVSNAILPGMTEPPILTVAGQAISADPLGHYIIGSQTLTPGGAITVSGTAVSIRSDIAALVVGGTTIPLHPSVTTRPAIFTFGGGSIIPNSLNQYTIDGQTLVPGGVLTVSGTQISLLPNNIALVIGSSTQAPAITAPQMFTIGKQVITANSRGQYIVGGQTLTAGGVITISGTSISLLTNNLALVIDSSTQAPMITAPPVLTLGTQVITANFLGQYIVDGQTLAAGGVVTVSGTPISLAADEADIVIGTSTEALGGFIIGGLHGLANASSPQVFTGAAARAFLPLYVEGIELVIALIVLLYL